MRSTVISLLALMAIAAGCGSDEADPVRPTPAKPADDVPAALRDPESSASAVRTYWRYVQEGAVVGALESYEPRVSDAVGPELFAGALAALQPQLAEAAVNPLRIESISGGELVTAESVPKVGAKVRHSFFLRERRDGGWRIVYDTLTANGLLGFAQNRVQRAIDPAPEAPDARALRTADGAMSRYRAEALRIVERARRAERRDGETTREP